MIRIQTETVARIDPFIADRTTELKQASRSEVCFQQRAVCEPGRKSDILCFIGRNDFRNDFPIITFDIVAVCLCQKAFTGKQQTQEQEPISHGQTV